MTGVQAWPRAAERSAPDTGAVGYTLGGGLYFDGARAADILHTYVRWTQTVPDEMTSSVGLVPLPDVDAVPVPCVVELRHLGGALARTPKVPSGIWVCPDDVSGIRVQFALASLRLGVPAFFGLSRPRC